LEVENKVEKTKLMRKTTIAAAAVAFVAILGMSFVLAPLATVSSPGSDSQIELIRAHTHYMSAHIDLPAPPISSAPASLSPDMRLIRISDGQSAAAQQIPLQEGIQE
jgi:hypothetical protein